jgi:hypothetical protein
MGHYSHACIHDFVEFYTDAFLPPVITQGKVEWIVTRQITDEL